MCNCVNVREDGKIIEGNGKCVNDYNNLAIVGKGKILYIIKLLEHEFHALTILIN